MTTENKYKVVNKYTGAVEGYAKTYNEAEQILNKAVKQYYKPLGMQNAFNPFIIVHHNAKWCFDYELNKFVWKE